MIMYDTANKTESQKLPGFLNPVIGVDAINTGAWGGAGGTSLRVKDTEERSSGVLDLSQLPPSGRDEVTRRARGAQFSIRTRATGSLMETGCIPEAGPLSRTRREGWVGVGWEGPGAASADAPGPAGVVGRGPHQRLLQPIPRCGNCVGRSSKGGSGPGHRGSLLRLWEVVVGFKPEGGVPEPAISKERPPQKDAL